MIKLNLGCGFDLKADYVNIDNRDIKVPAGIQFINTDLEYGLPHYLTGTVDEVLAKDILEHFSFRDTDKVFAEWIRVLKPGGKIILFLPNFDAHLKLYKENKTDARYGNTALEYFRANVFGGQDYPGNFHKTLFTPQAVRDLYAKYNLKMNGFEVKKRYILAIGIK